MRSVRADVPCKSALRRFEREFGRGWRGVGRESATDRPTDRQTDRQTETKRDREGSATPLLGTPACPYLKEDSKALVISLTPAGMSRSLSTILLCKMAGICNPSLDAVSNK
jgi:hypothetical protein